MVWIKKRSWPHLRHYSGICTEGRTISVTIICVPTWIQPGTSGIQVRNLMIGAKLPGPELPKTTSVYTSRQYIGMKLHRAAVFRGQSAERHRCGVSRDVTSPCLTNSPRISRVVICDKWNVLLRPARAKHYLLANCHSDMSPFTCR
jgi:hypothetical protein